MSLTVVPPPGKQTIPFAPFVHTVFVYLYLYSPGKQTVPFAPFVHSVQGCNEITFARWQLARGSLPLVSRLGRNIVKAKSCPGQGDTLALALALGLGLGLGLGQGDEPALGHSNGLSPVHKMFV